MKTLAVLICALLITTLVACGDDDAPPASDPSTTLVTFSRTGGFASYPLRLTVAGDGSSTIAAGQGGPSRPFELGADELETLRSQLAAAEFDAVEQGPGGCADCYIYDVEYDGRTTSYDDAADPPATVETAVDHLSEIAEAHAPPPSPGG